MGEGVGAIVVGTAVGAAVGFSEMHKLHVIGQIACITALEQDSADEQELASVVHGGRAGVGARLHAPHNTRQIASIVGFVQLAVTSPVHPDGSGVQGMGVGEAVGAAVVGAIEAPVGAPVTLHVLHLIWQMSSTTESLQYLNQR